MKTQKPPRPSDARRAALRQADRENQDANVPILSNFCPIDRYYNAADKVLAAFQSSYDANRLDDAYVFGRRFATFSTDALPTHDYYKSPGDKFVKLRQRNQRDLAQVIMALEDVADRMDAEEVERMKIEKIRKAEEERIRREQLRVETRRRKVQERVDLEDSAARKLAMLMPAAPSGFDPKPPEQSQRPEQPMVVEGGPVAPPSENGVTQAESIGLPLPMGVGGVVPLPVPVPPPTEEGGMSSPPPPPATPHSTPAAPSAPPPPPSYAQIMGTKMDTDIANTNGRMNKSDGELPSYSNLFPSAEGRPSMAPVGAPAGGAVVLDEDVPNLYPLSLGQSSSLGGPFVPTNDLNEPKKPVPTAKKKRKSITVPIKELRQIYTTEYDDLKRKKKVCIFTLNTYQGRIRSPGKDSTNGCTVISPLVAAHHLKSEGSGVADCVIEDVIDSEAPPILRTVRSKLGLGPDALIIPSDVHDYLVDRKILRQDKFVGVCGGNVLDPSHMGEFLKLLEGGDKNEHLHKKLGAAFFFHEHVVSMLKIVTSGGGSAWFDLVDSMPRESGKASRTRCKDRQSLEATLRWYACSKFSDSECSYIDRNDWSDAMCDFDPRVFQAFVWVE